jgi:hypothetical protein
MPSHIADDSAIREVYASDWRDFSIWCHMRDATSCQAHSGIVTAYHDRGQPAEAMQAPAAVLN